MDGVSRGGEPVCSVCLCEFLLLSKRESYREVVDNKECEQALSASVCLYVGGCIL